MSVYLVVKYILVLFYVCDESAFYVYRVSFALQQHMVLAACIVQLEEQLGASRAVGYYFVQLGYYLIVQLVCQQRDGDTVYCLVLDGLQIFYVLHFQVEKLTVAVALLAFGSDIYGACLLYTSDAADELTGV